MKLKSNFDLIILIIIYSLALTSCQNLDASNLSSIPQERRDLDGEYDKSGLAKRITKALKEDEILSTLTHKNNIYVAQNGSKIILRGTVPDRYTINRIVNIANNIEGVSDIDIAQVKILQSSK